MRKEVPVAKRLKRFTKIFFLALAVVSCCVISVMLVIRVVSAYQYQPPVRKITKMVYVTPQATTTLIKKEPTYTIAPTMTPKPTPIPTRTANPIVSPSPASTVATVVVQPARTIAPKTATPVPTTIASNRCLVSLQGNTYDVTALMSTHSGGNVFICSSDQTQLYLSVHGISLDRMSQYLVSGASSQVANANDTPSQTQNTMSPTSAPVLEMEPTPIPLGNFNFGDDGN